MKGERALPVPSLLIQSQRNHPNEIEFRRCIYGVDTTRHLIFYFGEVLELGTGDSPLPAARGGKRGGVEGQAASFLASSFPPTGWFPGKEEKPSRQSTAELFLLRDTSVSPPLFISSPNRMRSPLDPFPSLLISVGPPDY